MKTKRIYKPSGPISNDFILSDAPVNIIQGPIESGKSAASAIKLYRHMCQMPRWKDGKRRSRWLVTRSTYPDLRGSTVETWLYWFPPEVYGKFYDTEPYIHEMRFLDVEADVIFESFLDDRDEVIRSLRSKEYTGAWINECRYTPQRLFIEIATRTGRYPPKQEIIHERPNGLQQLVIADTNAPNTDSHWLLYMRGDVPVPLDMPPEESRRYIKPATWQFWMQPPALKEVMKPDGKSVDRYEVNPVAENLQNMAPTRYLELAGGKSKDEIDNDLMGRVVRVRSGDPVFPGFVTSQHVCSADMKPVSGSTVVVGSDHGMTPAVVFCQQINGIWYVFHEIVMPNAVTGEIAPRVKAILQADYKDCPVMAWGDPAGNTASQTDRRTPHQIYQTFGIVMRAPADKDNPFKRISAGRKLLGEMINGVPRVQIHPRCVRLIDAIGGGYKMKRVKTDDGTRIEESVVKNQHSHVAEAWQYAMWGGGEVRELMKMPDDMRRGPQSTIPKKRKLFRFQQR